MAGTGGRGSPGRGSSPTKATSSSTTNATGSSPTIATGSSTTIATSSRAALIAASLHAGWSCRPKRCRCTHGFSRSCAHALVGKTGYGVVTGATGTNVTAHLDAAENHPPASWSAGACRCCVACTGAGFATGRYAVRRRALGPGAAIGVKRATAGT